MTDTATNQFLFFSAFFKFLPLCIYNFYAVAIIYVDVSKHIGILSYASMQSLRSQVTMRQ